MQPNEEAERCSGAVAGVNHQSGVPHAHEIEKPSPGGRIEFVHQAKTLLAQNLVLLMGTSESSEQLESYLATIEALQVENGPKRS